MMGLCMIGTAIGAFAVAAGVAIAMVLLMLRLAKWAERNQK